MNNFQKLAQISRDIELLENAGKFDAAEILQRKFVREAQLGIGPAYPQVGLRKPQMGKMDLAVTPVSNNKFLEVKNNSSHKGVFV